MIRQPIAVDTDEAQRILLAALNRIARLPKLRHDPFIFTAVVGECMAGIFAEMIHQGNFEKRGQSIEQFADASGQIVRDMVMGRLRDRLARETRAN